MERGRLRLIALLLCAVFLLVGCGGSGGETTTENGEAAPARDTLIVGMDREPAGLDPASSHVTTAVMIFNNIYDTLLAFDTDMQIQPRLAESYEQLDDVTQV